MSKFFKFISRVNHDKRGATAVEYAMIVGLVAAAAFSTVSTFGGDVKNVFSNMSSSLSSKQTPVTTTAAPNN